MLSSPLTLTNMHVLLRTNTEELISDLDEISYFQLPRSCKTFLIDLDQKTTTTRPPFITCRCVEEEIQIFDDLESGLEVQCSQMTITEETIECPPDTTTTLDSVINSGKWFQLDSVVKGFKDVMNNGQKIWAS